ncbi:PREDICTED: uncharacterized protein LOC108570400 [Habropoda laboriosa]|uniref:uncharacterized protein LOC108570400 n=1 Tax=Habropoda laboriosa TaxID=597456 RepID=UPI00083DCB2B|nr:PREDICTED: uncharacterized protein LOC108570400 [Habropoda laboriosa]
MDNRRKVSTHAAAAAAASGNNWTTYPNSSRHVHANGFREECANERREVRLPGGRSSEESVVEIDETDVNKNNVRLNSIRSYPDESVYVKVVPKHNNAALREKYQRFNGHPSYNVPEAVTAMRRLEKLKELQMKRDMTERYYTQEIKRLIGEYYFGPKVASPSFRPNGRLQTSSFQPEDRVKKNLEPCGTMTTITRLDCGCIQETTRPIFTTAKGRVQRRNCSQSQDEIFLKLASTIPQEHLLSSLEQRKDKYRAKMKKRLSLDPRMCPKIPPAGDQGFETENEKRNDTEEREISEPISRPTSPCRKFSDTSATSV